MPLRLSPVSPVVAVLGEHVGAEQRARRARRRRWPCRHGVASCRCLRAAARASRAASAGSTTTRTVAASASARPPAAAQAGLADPSARTPAYSPSATRNTNRASLIGACSRKTWSPPSATIGGGQQPEQGRGPRPPDREEEQGGGRQPEQVLEHDHDGQARHERVQQLEQQRVAGRPQLVGEQLALRDVDVAGGVGPPHQRRLPAQHQQQPQQRAGDQHDRQPDQRPPPRQQPARPAAPRPLSLCLHRDSLAR